MRRIGLGALALCLFACASQAGINSWSTRGPFGGNVVSMAVDPTYTNEVYAVANCGLYRSLDGGVNWREAPFDFGTTGLFAGCLNALKIDPANSRKYYLATFASELFRSLDGGATFTKIVTVPSPPAKLGTQSLTISSDGSSIYFGSTMGIFRSTDGGATFSPGGVVPYGALQLIVSPDDSAVVYAASSFGLLKSTDSAATWTPLPLPAPSMTIISMALVPGSPNTLWLSDATATYSSTDEGATWTTHALARHRLHTDSAAPGILYAAPNNRGGVLQRFAAGAWQPVGAPVAGQVTTLTSIPGHPQSIMTGTRVGVLRTLDGGASWTRSDDGIDARTLPVLAPGAGGRIYGGTTAGELAIGLNDDQILQRSTVVSPLNTDFVDSNIVAIGAHPTDENIVLAGLQNSGLRYSHDGGISWQPGPANFLSESVRALAFDTADPRNVYAAVQPRGAPSLHIERSTDGGVTFSQVGNIPTISSPRRLIVDPNNPARLFLASYDTSTVPQDGLSRSLDSGATWTSVYSSSQVFDIAVVASPATRIYLATADGLLVSDDGGATFEVIETLGASTEGRPYSIAVDPGQSNVLYVIWFSSSDSTYTVRRSVDGGATWESLPTGFRSSWNPANLVINASNPTVLTMSIGAHGLGSFEIVPNLGIRFANRTQGLMPGVPANFEVRVTNSSLYGATRVVLTMDAPAGASDVSGQMANGACTTEGTRVRCSIPFVKHQDFVTAKVTYTPNSSSGDIKAAVSARERDWMLDDNAVSVPATIPEDLDLSVTGSATSTSTAPNSGFSYTFRLTNAGTVGASANRLRIQVDAGATINGVSLSDCRPTGNIIDCNFAFLPAGQAYEVTVNATAASTGTLRATATVSRVYYPQDANPANDSATVEVVSRTEKKGGGGGGSTSLAFVIALTVLAIGRSQRTSWNQRRRCADSRPQ